MACPEDFSRLECVSPEPLDEDEDISAKLPENLSDIESEDDEEEMEESELSTVTDKPGGDGEEGSGRGEAAT